MTFTELKIIEPILMALKNEGYTNPTPIQEQAIPELLLGKDMLGSAQTGTGKTAAFAIPIIQNIYNNKEKSNKIKALILAPTRELAIQIGESFRVYGKNAGLRTAVIFGGVPHRAQINQLKSGVDILIATPGRLLDLHNQKYINLSQVKYFVLDEADRMMDMGFIIDVNKIVTKIPKERQTMLFSATMPKEIVKLANAILTNPIRVAVTPVESTVDTIKQRVYYVAKKDKKSLLLHILATPNLASTLIFSRTKHMANKLEKELILSGIKAEAIHSNKSQNAREKALRFFKTGKIKVLVATDIASRGIDIDELSHVINYDLPDIPETYIHRIGRTGRAGFNGIASTFCSQEEIKLLSDIHKHIGYDIPVVDDHPFAFNPKALGARNQVGVAKFHEKSKTNNRSRKSRAKKYPNVKYGEKKQGRKNNYM